MVSLTYTLIKNEPALFIKQMENILVIGDLHLGFEREFIDRGINIPSQTRRILRRIKKIVANYRPHRLIFLGDVKHSVSKFLYHEWKEVHEFFESLSASVKNIEIVLGNHDGGLRYLLPKEIVVHPVTGHLLRNSRKTVALIHGHAWPTVEAFSSDILIMAHHHFTVELKDSSGLRIVEPVWVVTKWNGEKIAESFLQARGFDGKKDSLIKFRRKFGFNIREPKIIIMPAFNPLLGGHAINSKIYEKYLGPMFLSPAIDVASSEIYLLDGTYLGKVSNLRSIGE